MKIATVATEKLDAASIVEIYNQLVVKLGEKPNFLILYCSVNHDTETVVKKIREIAPDVPLHGATSCLGIMTEEGNFTKDGNGFGLLGLVDPAGSFGVGGVEIGDDPVKAAEKAVSLALDQANCPGEVPALIWLSSSPGYEELLIQGIGNIVGKHVPIAGGSSADNDVSGKWVQIANDSIFTGGVVLTVFFPSSEGMLAFHSGYEPTDVKGIITRAGGYEATSSKGIVTQGNNRIIDEIDGRPAADVYNEWVDGIIEDKLENGGNILERTTLFPLGRIAGKIGDVPFYQLSHPDSVTAKGSLTLFSDIKQGDEVVLMKGTIDSLITRAGRVASSAVETHSCNPEDVAGALLVYCAGCMLTVKDRLPEVVKSFKEALPNVPFLGTFTFGEQGYFLSGESKHGNLMISVLLFSKE